MSEYDNFSNNYERLGVKKDASLERIREAFRNFALDEINFYFALNPEDSRATLFNLFGAYFMLCNPKRRLYYDLICELRSSSYSFMELPLPTNPPELPKEGGSPRVITLPAYPTYPTMQLQLFDRDTPVREVHTCSSSPKIDIRTRPKSPEIDVVD